MVLYREKTSVYDNAALMDLYGNTSGGLSDIGLCLDHWANGLINSVKVSVMVILGAVLVASCRWSRPFATGSRGRATPALIRAILAFGIVGGVGAMGPSRPTPRCSESWRRPTDLELWAAGQQTYREQMIAANNRVIWERPIYSGGSHSDNIYAHGPPRLPENPPLSPDELDDGEVEWHDIAEDEERTTHISFWVSSPYWEPESLDVALQFPITERRVTEIIADSVRHLQHDWLNDMVPTWPQLSADYGSYIMIPSWVRESENTTVVLLDGRRFDKGVFPMYFRGPLTRTAVLRMLDIDPAAPAAVYVGGTMVPLVEGEQFTTCQGSLVQVLTTRDNVGWHGAISERFEDPMLWNPDTEHPANILGQYIEFQSAHANYLHRLHRRDDSTPMEIASEAYDMPPQAFWLRAPTERPERLCLRGRRVHSEIAVVEHAQHDREQAKIVILDLRPIGLWVQWAVADNGIFEPGIYLEGLQLEVVEGYSLVVHGGVKQRNRRLLKVDDGEVLNVTLEETRHLTPEDDSDGSDGGLDDETSEGEDPMPNSSDLSGPDTPPVGPGPFGPPPPQPVNSRSRSPRRDHRPEEGPEEPYVVALSKHLPPVAFEMDVNCIQMPHRHDLLSRTFWTWPPNWMQYDITNLPLKEATKGAMHRLVHWSQVMAARTDQQRLEAHIYTDGSFYEAKGRTVQCDASDVWAFAAPQALKVEQIAVAAALLWVGQSRMSLPLDKVLIAYDCQVAGMGATGHWQHYGEFGGKVRALEATVEEMMYGTLEMHHVKAHVGQEWNELVDVVAKACTEPGHEIPTVPDDVCQAFMDLDMRWTMSTLRAGRLQDLNVQAGEWLITPERQPDMASPLGPEDLIPMTTRQPRDGRKTAHKFSLKCLSVNIQGLKGKHRYLDEQWNYGQYQLIFIQETKDAEGSTASCNYWRLAAPSQAHWGTAIWVSKQWGCMTVDDQPLMIAPADVRVRYQGPRLLVMEITKGDLVIIAFSAHIPHAAKATEREDFMKKLEEQLRSAPRANITEGVVDRQVKKSRMRVVPEKGIKQAGPLSLSGKMGIVPRRRGMAARRELEMMVEVANLTPEMTTPGPMERIHGSSAAGMTAADPPGARLRRPLRETTDGRGAIIEGITIEENGGETGTLISEEMATGQTDAMEGFADAIREASEAIPGQMVETVDRVAQIRECLEALRGRMVETLAFAYTIRETFADGMMAVIFDYPIRETYAAGMTAEIVDNGGSQSGWRGWDDDQGRGPRPTEKVNVPTFTAEESEDLGNSARSYLRQIEVWKRITRLPVNQLGLILYQHLSGKAWIAAEELSVQRLSSNEGLHYFTSWVSARFLDLEVARIGRAFSDFFRKLRRRPGQTIREYNTEYDRLHGRLREVGCSLPEECSAWLYLDRLQLDEPQELNLLASVGNRYSLHHLQHAAVLHDRGQRKPWEANAKPRRTNYTHMTDHDLESDEEDLLNGEEGIPEDVAEAYVTYQSAKDRYRAQQRGRGPTGDKGGSPDGQPPGGAERRPGEKRNSEHESRIKAMKAKSFCSGCGRKGHWHKDDACPLNKGDSGAKGETGASVAMTTVLPADVFALKHVPNMLLGVADTACARTVAGTQWLQSYTNLLEEFGRKPVLQKECEAYRFGTGKVHYSSFYVIVAFRLGGFNIQVRTSIIAGDIPLLLSKTVLGKLGMVYDVQNGKADFKAINLMNYELTNTSSGHPAIPIVPVDVHSGGTPNLQVEDLRLQQAEQYMTVYAVAHHGPQAPKYSGIFYDKKLDPSTRDMLSQDRLQRDVFVTWWEKSKFDRDFWLETPYMWVRVHLVPRRAMFNPSTWRTGSTVQRDMLVSSIGDVRVTECVCCKTGGWIESTVDRWLPGQIDQACSTKVPVSRMTKAQLLQEALRVGATVHHTWTVVELRATIRDHVDTFHEKTPGQKMKGLSSMNLPDLKEKAREMGVMVPDKITKGNLLRLIRSTVSTESDTVMTIGRWKGSLYREIPDSYGSWAAAEVARSQNSSPELAMFARWWQAQQLNKSATAEILDEDSEAEPKASTHKTSTPSRGSWDEVSIVNDKTPDKGYPAHRGKGNTKATPKRLNWEAEEKAEKIMEAEPSPEALAAVKFDVGPPGPTCGIGCHRQRKWDVACCGEVCDEDRISEVEYVRGYYNQAVNFSTTHEPVRNDGDATGLSFVKAHDNMHNDRRDGVRNPCPLRFGDESFPWEDHSFEACQRLLGSTFTPNNSASLRPIQRGEGGEDGELYLTVGMYTHGGVHGITRATKDSDAIVRYLNHFGKRHLGEQATWSSISITKNVSCDIHRDSNNLRGSQNYCATFGQRAGGELWLEEEIDEDGAGDKEIVWKRDRTGSWVPGRHHNTKNDFVAFDPFLRHATKEWQGERWCITYHTVRGASEVGNEIKKFLRRSGFPLPRLTKPGKTTTRPKPAKSERKSIMNAAGKISVLMATFMAAAASYVSEVQEPKAEYDPIVMMEIGGYEGTYEATALSKMVIEPIMWKDYEDPEVQENAHHFVKGASPKELRIHLDGMPAKVEDAIENLIKDQIHEAGDVVLRGSELRLWETKFVDYVKYKNGANGDHWLLLGRPKRDGTTVSGFPRPHEVCMVGHDGDEKKAINLDGTGITFDDGVPGILQSSLRRLHQNLGHPRGEDLCRHLRLAGCEPNVIKAVKGMKCETCQASKHAQIARPTAMPRLLDFNSCVGVDIFYAHDALDKRHAFLTVVDWATTYQAVMKLEHEDGPSVERAFNTCWLTPFGPPTTVSLDLDGKVQAGLGRLCDWHNIKMKDVAAQAKWQGGVTERQIGWFKGIWERVVHELNIEGEEAELAGALVCAAKNDLRRRCGHSPTQWVLGKSPRIPEELCDPDSGGTVTWDLTEDSKFQRAAAIRASARVAFHQAQGDDRLRRGLLHRARTAKATYEVGEPVHYWDQPKDRRRPHWIGPAVIVGRQGGNYWVSRNGRCRLTAPEHLRSSGPEEIGEFLTMRGVRTEVNKLLAMDLDDPDTYMDVDGEEGDRAGTIGDDYRESVKRKDDGEDHLSEYEPSEDEIVLSGDEAMPMDGGPDATLEHVLPQRRLRRKTRRQDVQANPGQVLLTHKALTQRGQAKRQEKELRWSEIPESARPLFKEAEKVQWEEHLSYDALEPLTSEQSKWVRANVPSSRILPCRWAYRDKNWAARKSAEQAEGESEPKWRCKSRLVIGGHRDPDLGVKDLDTDAPTLSRPGLLCLMQLLANGLKKEDPWTAAAGDIQCAFLTGGYLTRGEDLYLHQPATGFPGLLPDQLIRIKKNIFGLATSPHEWWMDLQAGMLKVKIDYEGAVYSFEPCPLDPCIFALRKLEGEKHTGRPIGYVGTHVDDLLVIAGKKVNKLIQAGLSEAFPVDKWEEGHLDYVGTEILCGEEEVMVTQRKYAATRLFTLDIPRGVDDEDLAGPELIADNQSLIGALSWLSSQTRPDLTCSVSLAQQLQRQPTIADLKFTNQISNRATAYKEQGLRFRPLPEDFGVIVYHDAAWANALDDEAEDEHFRLSEEDKVTGLMTEGPFGTKRERKAKRQNSKVASQIGALVLFADMQSVKGGIGNFSIGDWRSRAGQRVCRSTFGAETQACVEGVEGAQYMRSFIETLMTGELVMVEAARAPLLCLSDCRSLFDHIHKQGIPRVPTDRRLAIDLAALRQSLKKEQWANKLPLGWVPSHLQHGDVLTKPGDPGVWWDAQAAKLAVPISLSEANITEGVVDRQVKKSRCDEARDGSACVDPLEFVRESATFQHALGHRHRIDFLMVGGEAHVTTACSWVEHELDLASQRDDHWAVAMQLGGYTSWRSRPRGLAKPKYDRHKMMTTEGRAILAKAWKAYQPPPWWEHVDIHCRHMQNYVLDVLNRHFTIEQGRPRARYITDEIWEWPAKKMRFKQKVQHRRGLWKELVDKAFQQWRGDGVQGLEKLMQTDCLLYQLASTAIGVITQRIKRAMTTSKNDHLQQIVTTGPQSACQLLRRVRGIGIGGKRANSGRRPLPALVDGDGKVANSQEQHDTIWLNHFAEQECGTCMRVEDYLAEKDGPRMAQDAIQWHIDELPTLQEVETVLRSVPVGKAFGLDLIPGEALVASPPDAAAMLHALMVKAAAGLQQPLQWRGGAIHSAWKGNGDMSLTSNHRSLFISSVVGKTYHRLLRNKSGKYLQAELHEMHLGSKARCPITFSTLYILSHMRRCRARARSGGVLFLDTTAAYYSVLREAVVGDIRYDETIARLMKRFNMDADDMRELWQVIHNGGVLGEAGAPAAIRAMIQDVHHRTWCVSKHTTGSTLATTYAGSRPGESLADAIFAFIYSRVIGRVFEVAHGEGLLSEVGYDEHSGAFGKPRSGTEVVLRPNLRRGKTMAIVSVVGQGSSKARHEFFDHGRPVLQLQDLQLEVGIAPQYVHLGGVVDTGCTMKPEMRRRLAQAGAAYEAAQGLLFNNKRLPVTTRAQLFHTTILSTFYNLAIWTPAGPAWEQMASGYTRILRRLLGPNVGWQRVYRIPGPFVHLATGQWRLEHEAVKSRMSLLTAMTGNGPTALWAILQQEQTWLQVIQDDLQQVATEYPDLPRARDAEWANWVDYLQKSPGQFKARVKRMLQKQHDRQCQDETQQVGLWGLYRRAVRDLPGWECESTWSCRMCEKPFKSKGGLGAHMFKAHRRMATYRSCVVGTACKACGREFWSTARLATHLRDAPACVNALRAAGMTTESVKPGMGSRAARQAYTEEYNLAPTGRINDTLVAPDEVKWPDTQRDAYRQICEELHQYAHWSKEEEVRCGILRVLKQFPLYFLEEQEIVIRLGTDLEELKKAEICDPWSPEVFAIVYAAVMEADVWLQPYYVGDGECTDTASYESSLRRFLGGEKPDWGEVIQASREKCGTLACKLFELDGSWEADEGPSSGACATSAALYDPLCFVPGAIVTLWQQVCNGQVSAVSASEKFWKSPYGPVFRALRADVQK
ncbi:RE2 [Symbiodinium sp. CCMP2592]|nr:RE2 [Symbiodinium sp. CCMP2592]